MKPSREHGGRGLISGCTGTPVGHHKCNCRLPVLTRIFAYLHGLHLSQEQRSSCLLAVYSESSIKKRIQRLNANIPHLRLWIRHMMIIYISNYLFSELESCFLIEF